MSSPFRGRWSLLAFGFAFAFFSSFGQTSFISVFGGAFRDAFDLTNGEWGSLYFVGTLASGLLITKVGALIDAIPLRRYAMAVVVGLAAATALTSVTPNAVVMVLAIFMLRFFGQGLMTHVAITAMAREFTAARGRAVSIAVMGAPVGEALFPALGALALALLGWRSAWLAASLACLLVVLPLAAILLRGHGRDTVSERRAPFAALRFLLRREMLLALPALMASGFIATAINFHQVLIAQAKGWPPAFFATSFVVFGVFSIASTLGSGWLVDRIGARRVARSLLVPLALGCFVLAASDARLALFGYMALMAGTNGAYATVTTALLAENYGVERLGSIRATAAAIMVVSTALSPMIFGIAADRGVPVDLLIACCGVAALLATALLRLSALTRARPDPAVA
jgi:MFS family permease